VVSSVTWTLPIAIKLLGRRNTSGCQLVAKAI
jgi:hypothetical protein